MPIVASYARETKISLFFAVGAVAALALGYGDLVGGGITVAPVLLTIAYLGLVPAAILSWGASADNGSAKPRTSIAAAPPYAAAAVVTTLILALYLVTLAPSTAM